MNSFKVTQFTASTVSLDLSQESIATLEDRIAALLNLQLSLEHVHRDVIGSNLISVNEMLAPQVVTIREMIGTLAKRIAILGGEPVSTPKPVVDSRSSAKYQLRKTTVKNNLFALDKVYTRLNKAHRVAIDKLANIDPVSEDIITNQLETLEQFQWFVRANIESSTGEVLHS